MFLDIDGVLNLKWKTKWDSNCVSALNEIIKYTGVTIVITSTWRVVNNMVKVFEFQKIIYNGVLHVTPIMCEDRGLEIKTFLCDKEYNKFLIVDDRIDDIEPYFPTSKILEIDSLKGIAPHTDYIIRYFTS